MANPGFQSGCFTGAASDCLSAPSVVVLPGLSFSQGAASSPLWADYVADDSTAAAAQNESTPCKGPVSPQDGPPGGPSSAGASPQAPRELRSNGSPIPSRVAIQRLAHSPPVLRCRCLQHGAALRCERSGAWGAERRRVECHARRGQRMRQWRRRRRSRPAAGRQVPLTLTQALTLHSRIVFQQADPGYMLNTRILPFGPP